MSDALNAFLKATGQAAAGATGLWPIRQGIQDAERLGAGFSFWNSKLGAGVPKQSIPFRGTQGGQVPLQSAPSTRRRTGGRGVSPSMPSSAYRPVGGNVFGPNPVDPFSGQRVGPGSPIAPGPGMGAPPVIVSSPARTRAENANTLYQQAGGNPNENYWTANPEIAKAASDPNRPLSNEVGYTDRADIQAWMDAQGRDSEIVKRFLADQEAKGLIRKPGEYANAFSESGIRGSTQDAVMRGFQPGAEAVYKGQSIEGPAMPDKLSDRAMAAGTDYYRGKGADLVDRPAPAAQPTVGGQIDWASAAPGDISLAPGNLTTSGQVRDMNLQGSDALGNAHLTQATATRPEPGAENVVNAPTTQRPEDELLSKHLAYLRPGMGYANAYSGIPIPNDY